MCHCRQSTLSQLEEQTFNLKNVEDFLINYKLSDIRGSKTMLWRWGKTVQYLLKETLLLLFVTFFHYHCESHEQKWKHWDIICKDVAQSSKQRIQVSGLFPIMPLCFLILYPQLFIHVRAIALWASQLSTQEHYASGLFKAQHTHTHHYYRPPTECISGKNGQRRKNNTYREAGPKHCCGAFRKIIMWGRTEARPGASPVETFSKQLQCVSFSAWHHIKEHIDGAEFTRGI